MSGEDFNLHAYVRAELEASPDPDPRVVARECAKRIPDADVRDALTEALVVYVRVLNTTSRRIIQTSGSEGREPRSSRWETTGGRYMAFLRQRESVGGEWKFLGDMTATEVLTAAALRIEHGERSIVVGRRYEALAAAMKRCRAKVVADLPEADLLAVFP